MLKVIENNSRVISLSPATHRDLAGAALISVNYRRRTAYLNIRRQQLKEDESIKSLFLFRPFSIQQQLQDYSTKPISVFIVSAPCFL